MVALVAIVPLYLVIARIVRDAPLHRPHAALDDAIALSPTWSIVYGSLFLAALLPGFVVHEAELLRRTILAYLAVWLVSYAVFLGYPTAAPAHADVAGRGFARWGLRTIYGADVPFNCLPSLHVAQCLVAAFACHRVHRGVGWVAVAWAALVALSTLFTKQHYAWDVATGALLGVVTCVILFRGHARETIPIDQRRVAPLLAAAAFATYGIMLAALWALYALGS
ncbi:MAG TPA: phosphatase PAP2 family protein [Usitatibacter sp.]|jgi:membrane-associated phospholipid phosphatase|nr:phosphatase PAP2 family protein [Usitatibacter sp.]